jgi:hypothetical protein
VGPPRRSRTLPDLEVIPTFHPAAALRQGDFFPFIWRDFDKLGEERVAWSEPTYVVSDGPLDAIGLIDQLEARGVTDVVIDIEVDVEKDIAFEHPNRYGMLCVGIGYAADKVVVLDEGAMGDERVRTRLAQFLRTRRIIAQNGKFDLQGLYPVLGGLKLWFDTMLASYVWDERRGIHGLKWQAREYLGAMIAISDSMSAQELGTGLSLDLSCISTTPLTLRVRMHCGRCTSSVSVTTAPVQSLGEFMICLWQHRMSLCMSSSTESPST